jgi:ubiquinone/menaquinone biosynthesis C-methylase UbiE
VSDGEVHPTAARGFEAAAAGYDRARPGYPPEAVADLVAALALGPGRRVADLGAGTGKLTRALLATGADVLAIEPVASMRAELSRLLPTVAVREGTAEDTGLPDAALDAATAAQAFHWFDPDRTFAELRRVLRIGGAFAIVFNRRDTTTPGQRAIDDLLEPYRGSTPTWGDHRWREALATAPAGFEPGPQREYANPQHLDLEGVLARIASTSFVAALDEHERSSLLAAARERVDAIAQDGVVVLEHVTELRILRVAGS